MSKQRELTGEQYAIIAGLNDRAFLREVLRFRHIGYGRMLQIISHLWFREVGSGALVADTCVAYLKGRKRKEFEEMSANDPAFKDFYKR